MAIVITCVAGAAAVALVGVPRPSRTFSSGSLTLSLTMSTVIVALVLPAGIVTGLVVASVKSVPLVASLGCAAPALTVNGTVTVRPLTADSTTVAVAVPPSTFSATPCAALVNATACVASSSRIVSVSLDGLPSVAFCGLPSVATTVSLFSSSASSTTAAVTAVDGEPAGMVSGPGAGDMV